MGRVFFKVWRIIAAGIGYIVFGVCALLVGLLFKLLDLSSLSRERKQRWIRKTIKSSCLAYLKFMRRLGLMTYSLDVDLINNTPGGAIIMANHPSLLDAIFMLAACDNLCCIVKSTLWNNFFMGATVRLAGYIPNNSKNFIDVAAERLQAGDKILIFPEGTRNHYDEQLDFKRGAANIAVISRVPLIPVLIKCRPRVLQKYEKWYQLPEEVPHFSFVAEAVLTIEQCIDTTKPRTVQYRHLTRFLKQYYIQWFKNSDRSASVVRQYNSLAEKSVG